LSVFPVLAIGMLDRFPRAVAGEGMLEPAVAPQQVRCTFRWQEPSRKATGGGGHSARFQRAIAPTLNCEEQGWHASP
jgi:hypothetical protein